MSETVGAQFAEMADITEVLRIGTELDGGVEHRNLKASGNLASGGVVTLNTFKDFGDGPLSLDGLRIVVLGIVKGNLAGE